MHQGGPGQGPAGAVENAAALPRAHRRALGDTLREADAELLGLRRHTTGARQVSVATMDRHRALLATLPKVRFAVAYGSAVFVQAGVRVSAPRMVDYLLAVDDARAWHAANLRANATHYAGLPAALGASAAASLAESIGAGVHFNAGVGFAGGEVKYGVMEVRRLRRDLTTWTDMYAAGRLHKPTLALVGGRRTTCTGCECNSARSRGVLRADTLALAARWRRCALGSRSWRR